MGSIQWLGQNWFVLLQNTGMVGSLLFTARSLRSETRSRRISNRLTITQQHRETWTQLYKKRELERVLSADVDLNRKPVTLDEELFVTLLILHLNASYYAFREGVLGRPEQLQSDIRQFFSLPIPAIIWGRLKPMQNEAFVRFVASSL